MRGPVLSAMAARRPDGVIVDRVKPGQPWTTGGLRKIPVVRGVIVLGQSLIEGFDALQWSSNIATGEETDEKTSRITQIVSITLSVVIMIGVFFAAPALLSGVLGGIAPDFVVHLAEGVIRATFLLLYLVLIGRIPEVREVFAYHGAEHKTIHAYEARVPLEIDEIQRFSPAHPRCGTSFLFTVMIASLIVFSIAGQTSIEGRLISRVLLLPLVIGISYEFLRFAAAHRDAAWAEPLTIPGLWLQRFTTREPRGDQVEVALHAFNKLREAEVAAPPPPSGTTDVEVNA